MKIKQKIALTILLIFLIVLSVVFPCFSAPSDIAFDDIPVLDDLIKSDNFNIYNYGFNEKSSLQLFNFVEYCYSPFTSEQGNYGLYLYLYNPGNIKFNRDGFNTVLLATGDRNNTSDYTKYNLKHLSTSTGSNENLFHKFKILDPTKSIIASVTSSKRIYNISGIELATINAGIQDYGIGGQYTFTGFAKGYGAGAENESTLNVKVDNIDTLKLTPETTYYRLPGENSNGTGHQDNLSTIYFSVPNSIVNKFDALSGVHMIWDEYHTSPMVLTSNETRYNAMLNAQGKSVGIENTDLCKYGFVTKNIYKDNKRLYWNTNNYYKTNIPDPFTRFQLDKLAAIKYTNKDLTSGKELLSSKDILELWKNYNSSTNSDKTPGGKYSMDLFQKSADEGRKFDHNDVWIRDTESWNLSAYTFKNGFEKFWIKLFGGLGNASGIDNIAPIYVVTDNDRNAGDVSSKLLISSGNVGAFNTYYDKAKLSNQTTYLIRHAVTDYYASEIFFTAASGFDDSLTRPKGLLVQQTAFLNLDILELEFRKEGVFTRIPVVMNPIDVIGGVTPPYDSTDKDGINWLYVIFILICVLIIFTIMKKTGLWDLVCKLIALPFKDFAKLFKGNNNKEEKQSVNIYIDGKIQPDRTSINNAKDRLSNTNNSSKQKNSSDKPDIGVKNE